MKKILQYNFNNLENLKHSLMHPSILKKNQKKSKNSFIYEFERLEFLGDRVLGLSIATLIFKKFTEYNEGKLSKKFSFFSTTRFFI